MEACAELKSFGRSREGAEEEWRGGGGERQVECRESCGRYLVLPALGSVGIGLQLQGPAEGTLQAGGHSQAGGGVTEEVQTMHPSLWPHSDQA